MSTLSVTDELAHQKRLVGLPGGWRLLRRDGPPRRRRPGRRHQPPHAERVRVRPPAPPAAAGGQGHVAGALPDSRTAAARAAARWRTPSPTPPTSRSRPPTRAARPPSPRRPTMAGRRGAPLWTESMSIVVDSVLAESVEKAFNTSKLEPQGRRRRRRAHLGEPARARRAGRGTGRSARMRASDYDYYAAIYEEGGDQFDGRCRISDGDVVVPRRGMASDVLRRRRERQPRESRDARGRRSCCGSGAPAWHCLNMIGRLGSWRRGGQQRAAAFDIREAFQRTSQ